MTPRKLALRAHQTRNLIIRKERSKLNWELHCIRIQKRCSLRILFKRLKVWADQSLASAGNIARTASAASLSLPDAACLCALESISLCSITENSFVLTAALRASTGISFSDSHHSLLVNFEVYKTANNNATWKEGLETHAGSAI